MNYDMIFGQDLLSELGILVDYKNLEITWDDVSIPMKALDEPKPEVFTLPEAPAKVTSDISKILEAKYKPADLKKVAADCTHLEPQQQKDLLKLLEKYEDLFDGTLGHWKGAPYKIDLKEGATPYYARPYPIPKAYEQTLKEEVDRLCSIGVLKKLIIQSGEPPPLLFQRKIERYVLSPTSEN